MFNKTPEQRKIISPSCHPFQPLCGPHKTTWLHRWNIYKRQSFGYIPGTNNCDEWFIHDPLFIASKLRRIGCLLNVNQDSQLWECDPFVPRRVCEQSFLWLCLSKNQGVLVSSAWGGTVSPSLLIGWRWAFLKGGEWLRKRRWRRQHKPPRGIHRDAVWRMFTKPCWSQVTFTLSMLTEQQKKKLLSERWRFCRRQFTAFLIALTAGEQRRLIKMPGGKGLPSILITTVCWNHLLATFAPETELTNPRVWSKNDKPTG